MDAVLLAAEARAGRPQLETAGEGGGGLQANGNDGINGDVMPRPPVNGYGSWLRASTLPNAMCNGLGARSNACRN
jgi:hypothetical protein